MDKFNNFIDSSFVKFLLYLIGLIVLIKLYVNHYYDMGFILIVVLYSLLYLLIIKYFIYIFDTYKILRFTQDEISSLNKVEFELLLYVYYNGTIYTQPNNINIIINLVTKNLLAFNSLEINNELKYQKHLDNTFLNQPVNISLFTKKFFKSTQGKNFLQSIGDL